MHDAPVACTRAFLSDFRVCDTVIPAFIGCIGKLSLSRTDRYPKQTPGKWVELDPTAGFEWGRCAGLEDIGLCTRWLYFKTTYWFPLDRRVLSGEKPTYDYDKKLILSAGFRFEF